jgi:glycosyltransferase involved in cell wall biosynthesis
LRILFVTDSSVAHARGGAEISAFGLALGLQEMGHDVVLATRSPQDPPYESRFLGEAYSASMWEPPTAAGRLETGMARSAPLSSLIARICRGHDFDIVHAHNWVSAYAAHRARSSCGPTKKAPWVLSIRDYRFLCPSTYGWCFDRELATCGFLSSVDCVRRHTTASGPARTFGVLPYSAYRSTTWRMLLRSLGSFDSYVACSRFLRSRFQSACGMGGPSFAVHSSTDVGQRAPPAPGDGELLYVGRLSVEKGVLELLSAFRSLISRRPESRLTMVGTGPLEGYLRRLCATDPRLKASVRIEGRVAPGETEEYYSRSSVVLAPSLWPEPLGRVPMEAMAAGRPVIASGGGGIPEVVEDGKTGILVPPGDKEALADAIDHLLSNPKKRRRMGRRGFTRSRDSFSTPIIASRFATPYKMIINA